VVASLGRPWHVAPDDALSAATLPPAMLGEMELEMAMSRLGGAWLRVFGG
jgi:hypothetical protein